MNSKPEMNASPSSIRRLRWPLVAWVLMGSHLALAESAATGASGPVTEAMVLGIGALAGMGVHSLAIWYSQRQRESSQPLMLHGLLSLAASIVIGLLAFAATGLPASGLVALTVLAAALSLWASVQTHRKASAQRQSQMMAMEAEIAGVAARMDELQRHELEVEFKLSQRETDLHNSQMLMRDMDYYDQLTGQPNQRLLADRFAQTVARCKRDKGKFAMLSVNIDQFRRVNEKRGRHVGDALLQATAKRLSKTLRSSDSLARLTGDDFVVLLHNTLDPAAIATACQKLIDAMHGDIDCKGLTVRVTISVGAAQWGVDGDSLDDLVRASHKAMRLAKADGGDRFRSAS